MTVAAPILRPLEPDDLPALQKIREAAFRPVFQSFRDLVGAEIAEIAFGHADAEQAKLLDDLCRSGSGQNVLVAWLDHAIIGFVAYSIDAGSGLGEIGLNAVHPDQAGKGVGTWIYGQVLDRMKALGVTIVTVGTGGDPSHAPARRAYEKAGFGPAISSVTLYKQL